ncbi:MAG: phosphate signaling complex protein PhoU [Candidatus Anstonellaceae archaeon]
MVREKYVQQLDSVKDDLAELGEQVCSMFSLSGKCIEKWDKAGQRKVVAMASQANRKFVSIEEKCLQMLARQQPVASDLRFITSSLHAARKLERCANYASEIAQTMLLLRTRITVGLPEFSSMGKTAEGALRIAVRGFVEKDMALSKEVVELEKENDESQRILLEKLKGQAQKGRQSAEVAFRAYMISKYLERAADNAIRITNATGYMVTGDRKYLLD